MKRPHLLALVASTFIIGCGDDRPPPPSHPFVVETINVALGPGIVHWSTPRTPPVAAALAAEPYDVLCVQEAWLPEGKAAIAAASGLPAAQIAFVDTQGIGEDGADRCVADDMAPVTACADGCRAQPDEEQSQCIEENCYDQLEAVALRSLGCIHCLAEEAGHPIDAIKQACLTTGAAHLYRGNNGIMLLSRLPMADVESMLLPSTSGNRVALFARVRPAGAETDVQIACTHLSANQALPPWRTGFSSWHDERMAQFSMIEKRLAERAAGGPQVFLGDFNVSPKEKANVAQDQEAWDAFMAAGFADAADETFCSDCPDSTFHPPTLQPSLIDHALFRAPGDRMAVESSQRALDGLVTYPGYDGAPVTTNLSDHDGVRATLLVR